MLADDADDDRESLGVQRSRSLKRSRAKRETKKNVAEEPLQIDMEDMDGRIREVFEMFDKDGSGQLDMHELRDVLNSLNPRFTSTEVAFYCKWLNESGNNDGLISHKEFMDWLEAGSTAAQDLGRLIIAETGNSIASRLRQIFRRFDKDASGTLDMEEMAGVFRVLSPDFTIQDIAQLLKELDTGGDKRVSRSEFMAWLQKGLGHAPQVKKAILANTGIRWEQRIRKAFDSYDQGQGLLNVEEMAAALRNLGSLTKEEVRNVCVDLDKSKDGKIDYGEFRSWIRSGMGTREIEKAKAILAPSDSDGLEASFYNFCGAGRAELDGKGFVKLCEDCELLDKKFSAVSADLIFCDTRVKRKGERTIDVVQFEVALELLAERKGVTKQGVRMQVLLQGKPLFRSPGFLAKPVRSRSRANTKTSTVSSEPGAEPRGPPPPKPQKVPVSGLWKVLGRHTNAGRCLWLIYGNSGQKPRPEKPAKEARTRTARRVRPAPEPDFSDLCVKVVYD